MSPHWFFLGKIVKAVDEIVTFWTNALPDNGEEMDPVIVIF